MLPLAAFAKIHWAKTEIEIENPYIVYRNVGESISIAELDEWIVSMFRLLAGAYAKEYSIKFEKAGIAVDFYPYTVNGEETSREERRKQDCVMALRLLMRDKESGFLGGVYTLLFHRQDIIQFAEAMRKEFDEILGELVHGIGEFTFAGVSPLGYKGCSYWYLDTTKKVQEGDYVWVRMGRHHTEQIVYVDRVCRFHKDSAPYAPSTVKRILRKASLAEIEQLSKK
jgi:hypothetical protein